MVEAHKASVPLHYHSSTFAYYGTTDTGKKHCRSSAGSSCLQQDVETIGTVVPHMHSMLEKILAVESRLSAKQEHVSVVVDRVTAILEEVSEVDDRIAVRLQEEEQARTTAESKLEKLHQGVSRDITTMTNALEDMRGEMVHIAKEEVVQAAHDMFDRLRRTAFTPHPQ